MPLVNLDELNRMIEDSVGVKISGSTFLLHDDGEEHGFNPILIPESLMEHAADMVEETLERKADDAETIIRNWKDGRRQSIAHGLTRKGERKIKLKMKTCEKVPEFTWRCELSYDYGDNGHITTVCYSTTALVAFAICSVMAPSISMYQEFVINAYPGRDLKSEPMTEDEMNFVRSAYVSVIHPDQSTEVAKS